MTVLEIIVILGVTALLAAALTAIFLNYFEDTKISKAQADVKAIAEGVMKLSRDVGHFPFYKDGNRTTGDPDIDVLVGPGADPPDDTGKWLVAGGSGGFPGQGQGVEGGFPGKGKGVEGGFPGQGSPGTVTDGLDNHLVKNSPAGTTDKPYPKTGLRAWRGPYLEKIAEDPWGHRYLVNIKNADPDADSKKTVWALSAGPNGRIETDPNSLTDSAPTPGGDDVAVRIR